MLQRLSTRHPILAPYAAAVAFGIICAAFLQAGLR